MKKNLFYGIALLLVCGSVFSQNYRLFPKEQKAYFLDTTVLKISANGKYLFYAPLAEFESQNAAQDSTFMLFGESPESGILSFDRYVLMKNGNQKIYFPSTGDSILLLRNAEPGDSWDGMIRYTGNNETITYQEKIFEPVCGIYDSVKVYVLPGNEILKVSKTFGLVEIPLTRSVYENAGPVHTAAVLFMLPHLNPERNFSDLRNIVKFTPGYIYGGTNTSSAYFLDHLRFEIIGKEVQANSIDYTIGFWDDEIDYSGIPCMGCVRYRHRDTATLTVGQYSGHSPNARIASFLLPHVSFSNYGYMEFLEDDTIVTIGHYMDFEGSSNVVSSSFQTGYRSKLKEEGSPAALQVMNVELPCYYLKGAPEAGCERVEELTPLYEALSGKMIQCIYDANERELLVSWAGEMHTAKISIVDAHGKIVHTQQMASAVSIPCSFANGYYNVLIDSEKGNFRKAVSVY